MSEKSSGAKGKPPDKKDGVASESSQNTQKEKSSGSNLNENASSVENQKGETTKDKAKVSERKVDAKPPSKINGIKNGVTGGTRAKRDDERRYYPPPRSSARGRYEPKVGAYPTSASSPRSESKRAGMYPSVEDTTRTLKSCTPLVLL